MKKVTFVVSHLGSGSHDLVDVLNKNPRCVFHNSNTVYDHPTKLEWLYNYGHKLPGNAAAIYGDHLLFNMSFCCTQLYKFCKFIYIIRPARATISNIISLSTPKYTANNAVLYYAFRLRRICEMAKRTPGSVLLTWDDLTNASTYSVLENYLNLIDSLKPENHHFRHNQKNNVDSSLIEQAEDTFDRHFYYLKNLNLITV